MSDFNTFKSEWIGKRIADPSLAADGLPPSQWYQCVSLIKQYLREDYGLTPGYWGNASRYWTAPAAALLTKFYKVPGAEALQGDIVVVSPDHIGIATGNVDASTVEILEQNGSTGNGTGLGKDAIRTRYIAKSRVMGLLRPYVVSAPPASTPAYTVLSTFPQKIYKANKQPSNKYDITFRTFEDVASHVMETFNLNATMGATMVVNHVNGQQYYLNDLSDPGGYNIHDWDEVVPVVPPPYVPPALPSAPVVVKPAETYTLVTSLPTYTSDLGAINRANGGIVLAPGIYYVWAKIGNVYQLGTSNMTPPADNWVNTLDNKKPIPPVIVTPAPTKLPPSQVPIGTDNDNGWKATYKSFHANRSSDVYETKQPITMKEYSGRRKPIPLPAKYKINVIGTFVKNGVTFYRPRDRQDASFAWYFGIPMYDDDGDINLVKVAEPVIEEAEQSLKDIVYYLKDDLRRWWDIKVLKRKGK